MTAQSRRISLVVEDSSGTLGRRVDVLGEIREGAVVGDLIVAAGACVGDNDSTHLRLADGTVVAADVPIDDLCILDGACLALVRDAGEASTRAACLFELVGEDIGVRRLGSGRITIGRDPGSDIVVDHLSVSRHHASLTVGSRVVLTDHGSKNGTFVNGQEVRGNSDLGEDSTVVFGNATVVLRKLSSPAVNAPSGRPAGTLGPLVPGREWFNRPPRVIQRVVPVGIAAPELPTPPTVHRLPWLSAAIPVVMAVAVYVMSTVLAPDGGLDGGYAVISVVFLLMSPLMIVASHLESKRAAKIQTRDGRAAFDAALDHARRVGREAVDAEVRIRRWIHAAPSEVFERIRDRDQRLWEWTAARTPPCVRVGTARLATEVRLVDQSAALPDLRLADSVDRIRSARAEVDAADDLPVVVDLSLVDHIGLTGTLDACRDVARWLVLQIAAERSPLSLDLAVIAQVDSEGAQQDWDWVKWLPHQSVDRHNPAAKLVSDPADIERLMTSLSEANGASGRASDETNDRARPPVWSVVVVDASCLVDRERAASVMRCGPARGVHVIWIESDAASLPGECGAVIGVGRTTRVEFSAQAEVVDKVDCDRLSRVDAETWARSMAPLVDRAGARVGSEAPPTSVSIADLYGGNRRFDDVASIGLRWSERSFSLRAPIGRTSKGPLSIDLHTDGPHGIVGGTTGAGKSELLQTMVVSMAATHSPTHLNFLLIDYKGGAAFGPCVSLPHTVGVVTDLDGDLVDRVLTSLGAELRRRERILGEAGVKDLRDLLDCAPAKAPPSLVIVVDEFASLVGDVPTFMPGMVDLARRGRSLGLHLLLATQRPAGVIGDDLRANASLRIGLRFADAADSVDVLGSPVAASIDRATPGRALAQLGTGEAVAFQTAYCGGRSGGGGAGVASERELLHRVGAGSPVRITPFTAGAMPPIVAHLPADAEGGDTDLQRLVRSIGVAARDGALDAPRRPWLEPLPDHLPWIELVEGNASDLSTEGLNLVIGRSDEPERQRQSIERLDLDEVGSVAVYGRAGAGKSSCLRTIAVAAVLDRDPRSVRVDGIEFAGSSLLSLEQLPQVGSILSGDDTERVGRLLDELAGVVSERVRASSDPDSTSAQRRLLLIDDFTGFASHHESLDGGRTVDRIARLVVEGRAAGVHVVLSADRRVGVPASVAGGIGCRIVLAMTSEDEETSLGVPMGVAGRPRPPGRALIGGRPVQVATLDGRGTTSRSRTFDELVASQRSRFPNQGARPIGRLASRIVRSDLGDHPGGLVAALGTDGANLGTRWIDLAEGSVLVAGPRRSGRSTALMTLATTVREGSAKVRLVGIAARPGILTSSRVWNDLVIGTDAVDLIDHLIEGRQHTSPAVVVVVDDLTDLDDETDEAVGRLIAAGRDSMIRVVASVESGVARTRFGGAIPILRRERRALLLQPDIDLDGDLVGVRLQRRGRSTVVVGRGEFVDRGEVSLVQVALPDC